MTLTPATLSPSELPAYLDFARLAWGADSPQASARRLEWLYSASPITQGMERDLLVLRQRDRIIGAHHRMRIPWNIRGERLIVPSLHDLAVLPEYRTGGGLQLILAALAREAHVALFGLSEAADQIYQRMRVPTIPLWWLQKLRNPARIAMQMSAARLDFPPPRFPALKSDRFTSDLETLSTPTPTDSEINAALSLRPQADAFPDWDTATFRWRYFHPLGPRNLLFLARKNNSALARAVVSLGVRNGVLTARIVELLSQENSAVAPVLAAIERYLDRLRVPLAFAVTGSETVLEHLISAGYKLRSNQPGARWFAQKKTAVPETFWISGGAWDFGCDSGPDR
ncbi:MAG TPA: hypothetical protein VJN64_04875 [Terriglobales bacterium]|nr:hypothetical protein [Terriglobales bacterium]